MLKTKGKTVGHIALDVENNLETGSQAWPNAWLVGCWDVYQGEGKTFQSVCLIRGVVWRKV